jgi:conjugal transfer pilus assembly protein TraW
MKRDLILPRWLPLLQLTFMLGGVAGDARAENLGTVGPTYPIAEPHLLRYIEHTLREKEGSGELARLQEEAQRRVVDAIEHPEPLPGIRHAETARTFYFDPSVRVEREIRDDRGNILVSAGTVKNPLEVVSLSRHLLFFDGADPGQVRRARALIDHYRGRVKPILVAGSYLKLMRAWRLPVYFDQKGVLTDKFGIHRVPALVSQEGMRLRIDELRW